MYTIDIWVQDSSPDILLLSETWLNGSVSDKDIEVIIIMYFNVTDYRKGEEGPYRLPFKSLGSLRNVLVFERKSHSLSIKITSN